MTEPENSLTLGVSIFLIVLMIVGGGIVYYIFHPNQGFDVSNIPDTERWYDLNNIAARDRFCQAQGYTEAKISEKTLGGRWEFNYAGSPYGYDILCKRTAPEEQIYDYSAYKQWLI